MNRCVALALRPRTAPPAHDSVQGTLIAPSVCCVRQSSTLFSFENCQFKVQKSKESTGRIVFWREYKILFR